MWTLHSALEMVDMTNESSALFFELLQQTVVNSNYLSTEEVRSDQGIIQHFLLVSGVCCNIYA